MANRDLWNELCSYENLELAFTTARKIFSHLNSGFFVISANYAEFEEHKSELIKKAKMSEITIRITGRI